MDVKKVLLPSLGKKMMGDFPAWAIIDEARRIVTVDYHPAFETLYPRGSKIPCRIVYGKSSPRIELDWEEIYANIYEDECEYEFNAIQLEEDERLYTKKLLVKDDYGFEFYLFKPSAEDRSKVGGKVTCRVDSVSDNGLELSSITGGQIEDEDAWLEKEILFDKLHDARVEAFKVFNDRDFRGVWQSVIDKYPDTAHFIYELLQNADDAMATDVTILLDKKSLIFKHNGTVHFSITDVEDKKITPGHINSITAIGASTKSDNDSTNKIGKFGIGFKSVFQYTDAPEVYDEHFRFRINHYIVPERIAQDHPRRDQGETLFLIPFKNPQAAYKEIGAKLKVLANGTLFLHNLTRIRWKDLETRESKQFSKTITESFESERGILLEKLSLADYDKSRNVLMFSRVVDLGEEGRHKIYAGYYLHPDGAIDTTIRPKVHCFFPTSESFNVCLIFHAPFLLVDNRQQIKPNEKVNEKLVDELGHLAANTLCELRDLGLREGNLILNHNIEKIVRWNEVSRYSYGWHDVDRSIIQPKVIVDACLDKIKNEELLLSVDQTYMKGPQSYKVSPKSLASLITTTQFRQLRKAGDKIGILCEKLNDLYYYGIEDDIEIKEYSTEDFAKDITPEFMKGQPIAWINRLFTFLNNEVRNSWNPDERNPYFLYSPIVETSNGEWVSPFVEGRVNVFSEGDPKEYNVISQNMIGSKPAMKFLSDIGCKEPDLLDHIINHVLPKYKDEDAEFEEDMILSDFNLILKYYKGASLEARESLLDKAGGMLVIGAKNIKGEQVVLPPGEVFLDTEDLKRYFKGNESVFFFDNIFYKTILRDFGRDLVEEFLEGIGILTSPNVESTSRNDREQLNDHQREQIGYRSSTRGITVIDYNIQGLNKAIAHIQEKADAISFWRIVSAIPLNSYSKGIYKYFYRRDLRACFDSHAIELLRNKKWIIIDGNTYKPAEISLEKFVDARYEVNYELCELLGIKKHELNLAAAGASKEQIENERLGAIAAANGLTAEDLLQLAADKKKRENLQKAAERREKMADIISDNRRDLQNTGDDSFVNTKEPSKSQKSDDRKAAERQERLQEQKDKALNDIARNEEYELLRSQVKDLPRYSKEWFEALLELEYKNDVPKDSAGNTKAISIAFGKVVPDPVSDRVFILKNPSRPIPIEIETIERIEVHFEFMNDEDKSIVFEVASVRDFTLRLKAKAADARALAKINWEKCTRATVNANNPTELIGKLITAFKELDVEDGFDFKENLEDNISFVFGPPGTGKTTYVARQICDLMKQEDCCKILVLTPTNKACDVITEKIATFANYPGWLGRFVATGSEIIESSGLLCNRDSELDEEDKCCLVSTIARLPYDGFQRLGGAPRLRDIDWNYVIIDEASMIPLAQIVYAIYRFSPYAKIIIAGDPLQIPPIASEEEWKEENIYTMVHLDRFDNPKTEPIQFEITNLTTQYRSIPAIGEVFSKYSYNGLLQHHRTQDDHLKVDIAGLPLKPINFIQFRVEKYDNIYGPKKLSGSNVQIYSVLLVTEICKYVASHCEEGKQLNIGIICPYVAESQMIERLIEQLDSIPETIHFSVGTIHGFQGDECDMVFVVFNPPKAMASQPDKIMLNKKHIINVAISRARDYLFLLIPHKDTEGYANLREINTLGRIVISTCQGEYQFFTSDDIERILFGRTKYLEENTFVTSHQMANVYTEAGVKYEVRIDDNSVDVQISDVEML